MKTFQQFCNEAYIEGEDDFLIYLINDIGDLVDKRGYAREGMGIFEYSNFKKTYPAGIDLEGNLWYNQSQTVEIDGKTSEVILNSDQTPLPFWETQHKYTDLVYQYQKEVIEQNRVEELFRMRYDILPEIKQQYPDLESWLTKMSNVKRSGII
jgi:hypothetical protein